MKGRKPKPTALKLLDGNPGKRAINREEPKYEALGEAVPDELLDPVAAAEWRRIIVPAIRQGHVRESDRALAIMHCELWATWRSQLADACRHAHVIAVGKHHHPAQNPARGMANRTAQMLIKVDAELGLSPASRARVHVGSKAGGDDEDSELARLLAIK